MEGADSILKDRPIIVGLDAASVFIHRISLPKVLERELSQVIPLRLEQDLPLPLNRVCTSWYAKTPRGSPDLEVEVLVIHRSLLERVLSLSKAWGASVSRIGLARGEDDVVGDFLTQRPPRLRRSLNMSERRLAMTVGITAALLLSLVAGHWLYERVRVGRALQPIHAEAARADQISGLLDTESTASRSVASLMAQPDALDALAVLTEVTPKDSWIYQLQIEAQPDKGTEAKLSAYTPVATMLLSTYRQSGQFSHVQLITAGSAGLGRGDRLEMSAAWGAPEGSSGVSQPPPASPSRF